MEQPVQYMTVEEVAARWRVSKMTVYRLIHEGTLATVQIGRSFRIPVTAVVHVEEAKR